MKASSIPTMYSPKFTIMFCDPEPEPKFSSPPRPLTGHRPRARLGLPHLASPLSQHTGTGSNFLRTWEAFRRREIVLLRSTQVGRWEEGRWGGGWTAATLRTGKWDKQKQLMSRESRNHAGPMFLLLLLLRNSQGKQAKQTWETRERVQCADADADAREGINRYVDGFRSHVWLE
ncbi:hypothetical protein BD289DRAFT_10890 [Coniella lustricola]|uniref:Uncharacterized protein n=1 Tax=Coniella lustricola TaxID=2025994 RepID=A0A2T3A4F3_9PEZI|nr:hypothetical protein BD289DRAFT_10890 [Coniella lustricola]